MSLSDDPWELPSARAFLSEIEGKVAGGGALVTGGISLLPGLDSAITRYFLDRSFRVELIEPTPDRLPAGSLAEVFGATPEAISLARNSRLADHLAVVAAETLDTTTLDNWRLFLARFLNARADQDAGLAILLRVSIDTARLDSLPLVAWNGRLRRIDLSIWADLHVPLDQPEPLATLAAALAVELCGWRLDLAAEIARARRQDLLDPIGWLKARAGQGTAAHCRLDGREIACPLVLYDQGQHEEIGHRIWKAQLTALFPWLEAHRQRVIERHRKLLRVDDHLRQLGVRDVGDLEFGALAWQLGSRLGRSESDLIECFAALRNDLAHRKAVKATVLDRALREAQQFGIGV